MVKQISIGRDLLFGGINGLIFGALLPVVMRSFNVENQPSYLLTILFFIILAVAGVYIGYQLAKIKPFFFQLAKFGATGAANFSIDIGILALLIIAFYTNNTIIPPLVYALFKSISFILATINSYLWNKFWSFKDNDVDNLTTEFGKFILVSLIGIIINVAIATGTNSLYDFVMIDIKTWAAISAMVGSVGTLSWNFIGYKFIVFKK